MRAGRLAPWALASVLLVPVSPLVGWLGAVVGAAVVAKPHGVVTNYFAGVSRSGVLVIIAMLAVGTIAAIVSLGRRERPAALGFLGLGANALTLLALWHGQYAKLGYDQDYGAAPRPGYRTVGEGVTATETNQKMQAARAWSAASCETAGRAATLTGVPGAQLRLEEPYALAALAVTARDASGAIVPSVPVTIDAEETTPSILYFFEHRLAQGPTAHSAGLFHFRIRTRCPGAIVELRIPARAVRP